jgi:hypothetical protein
MLFSKILFPLVRAALARHRGGDECGIARRFAGGTSAASGGFDSDLPQ